MNAARRSMKTLLSLPLIAAAFLLVLPASASAKDRSRTRSRDADHSRVVDASSQHRGKARGHHKHHRRGNRRVYVEVERPRVVISQPRVVVRAHCDLPRLSRARYHDIRHDLRDAWFSDEKLEIIRRAAARYSVTSSQAAGLVSMLSFDSDRVQALVTLYPSVLDPGHFDVALDALTFSSSRRDVRRRIHHRH